MRTQLFGGLAMSDTGPTSPPSPPLSIRASTDVSLWGEGESKPLRRLYEQARAAQWDPTTSIDWSIEVPFGAPLGPDAGLQAFLDSEIGGAGPPLWNRIRWEFHAWLVSQFYHGEQAALVGAARLAQSLTDLDAKKLAASQAMDEARHVDAFGRYLGDCIPVERYGVSIPFTELVASSLADSRWDFAALGIQVLVEGVALGSFRMAQGTLHDPLIRSIVRLVMQDETRHVAFGLASLESLYGGLTAPERRERADFLIASAELISRRFLFEEIWERTGIDPEKGVRFAASDHSMVVYRRAVFRNVIQIVQRLGLFDVRVERHFALLGLRLSRSDRHPRR